MKVGIITFHRAINYGATLQCYALCSVLQRFGCEIEVIDYYPQYLKAEYGLFPKNKDKIIWLKSLLKTLIVFKNKRSRLRKFKDFLKLLPLSKFSYNESSTSISGYDIIIFGSDQIWNPLLTNGNGIDKIFSGLFWANEAKLISYAASTNRSNLDKQYIDYFYGIINRFDHISVRESYFASFLNRLKSNVAKTVLDPVLLLEKYEWENLAIVPKEKRYLLIYTVPKSEKVRLHADIIAKELDLDIIEITPSVRKSSEKSLRQSVSPQEFVGYFLNAEYIVTTSFHGTAFSIKLGKQFSTIRIGTAVDGRAMDLMKSVGLESRAVINPESEIYKNIIDYSEVSTKLNKLVKDSLHYLSDCIGS